MNIKVSDILVFAAIALAIASVFTIYNPTIAEWIAYCVCGLTIFVGYMSIRTITSSKEVSPQMIAFRHVLHVCAVLAFIASTGFVITKHAAKEPLLPDGSLYVMLAIIMAYLCVKGALIKNGTTTQMAIDNKIVSIIHIGTENKRNTLRIINEVKNEIELNLDCSPSQKRICLTRVSSLYDNVFSLPPNQIEDGMPLYILLKEIEDKLKSYNWDNIENIQEQINILNDYNNKINRLIN